MRDKNIKANTRESILWLQSHSEQVMAKVRNRRYRPFDLVTDLKDSTRILPRQLTKWWGNLYCFYYYPVHFDPKTFWDAFPMVFVMERHKDHIIGCNLHYIPPQWRYRVMLKMLPLLCKRGDMEEGTYFRLVYNIIKSVRGLQPIAASLHRYNYTSLRSRFFRIPPRQWELAIWMPTDRFIGKQRQGVWNDFRKNMESQIR